MLKYQISWKSVQWEQNCSMWMDRPTDMTKLIIAFLWFCATRLKTAYTTSPRSLLGVISQGGQHTQACMLAVPKHIGRVLRKTSSQYSWRSEQLVATLNARPQVVKQPQKAMFYIQQVYSFSIGSTPGVRKDPVRLIVQPFLPLSSDTTWL